MDPVLVPSIDLPPEKECKITLGDVLQPFPVGHGATSSLPSSPLTGGVSAPTFTGRSTIKFGQAVIRPITFAPPTMDYSFFKKPVSTDVPAPQRGWGAPSASSSPLLKEPCMSPPDTPDITKSLTDPSVLTEDDDGKDDDDGMLTPGKTDPSNIRDVCKGSKWQESLPLRKHGLKVWWSESQNHAKPTIAGWMGKAWRIQEGARIQRDALSHVCSGYGVQALHFWEMFLWSTPNISSVPSMGFGQAFSEFQKYLQQDDPWLQQSQSNSDHFWKKDTALVKALRQYHLTSNVLEGQTQWKFQKSRILHWVLDVIAVNMESMKRCLDFHDSTPVDQGFRHWDLNLHWLKTVAIKEVTHLTMILISDEDHTHYSDAFRNIFKGGALCKKHFPDGSSGIKMRKGGAMWAIVRHFCPNACSNDDYAYCHLVAIHLNIQWGCRMCFGYISGYLSKIREHVQSHHKKSSKEWSHSSCRKDDGGKSDSSSDGILSKDKGSVEEFEEEEEEEEEDEESGSYADEVSPDASDPE